MKKNKNIKIILFIVSMFIGFNCYSQDNNLIPVDIMVRSGKLSNGLTYYIRHNELPKQRAEFYIVQRVGSILEEEPQRGLAHFLEHMCFNGTKHFPGNALIKELESKGIKFGENINAYTSIDETVYNLSNIPVTREGLVDTALLVLHDWSGFVSLNDKDIDDERGVIREEWRTRNNGDYRVMIETMKNIFPGSQYAERMPIGMIEVINTFPYQAIRDYYAKWYRPDLQGIIVVGDIDVNKVEQKIKALFADVPTPVNPAEREYYQVPDNAEPIVSVVSDPEVQRTGIIIFYKKDVTPDSQKCNPNYLANKVVLGLVQSMFNQRLFELSQKPNPPFDRAIGSMSEFYVAKTKEAWTLSVNPKNNNDGENALKAVLMEGERMRRYGFTASELERVKVNMLRGYESAYNERTKQENDFYVSEYVQNFTNGEPYPGIEWEYTFVKKILSNLTIEQINVLAKTLATDSNVVFAVTGPKKNDVTLPSKERILAVWNEVRKANVEPYADEKISKPLVEKVPSKGKIVKTEQKPFGYTQWTLTNGARVLIKQTDFKKDQVNISAYSPGGLSLIEDKDLHSAMAINSVVGLGGVGQLSRVELGRVLTGKRVSISPSLGTLSEGINGSASPKDFETLMQLTYLYFTQPRMDRSAFDTWNAKMKVQLENESLNPISSLKDTLNKLRTNNHPRSKPFSVEILNKVDYAKAMGIYSERFANAADFTFFITGNVAPDSIKEYVETYIGGLPSSKKTEKFVDQGIYPPNGVVKNNFNKKLETPKSTVVAMYNGEIPYTLQNMVLMDYLQSVLNIVYTEKIREKEGGTYGVSVNGSLSKNPKERFSFVVQFDTDPAKKDKLVGIVYDEIRKISEQAPREENVNKVKEYTLKSHQEGLIDNSYWESAIRTLIVNGLDTDTDYEKVVKSITPEMIRDFARKLFSQGNLIEVSMNPSEK